jgi:hypothetical protein
MTCIPYPWQIETKWLSEVWVRPCPTSLLPASSFDAQPQPVVSPAVEPVAVAFCAMISCQLLLPPRPPRPPKRRRTSPDGTQEEAQFHCPQLPSIRSAKCKRNHLESMPREFGFKFVLVNAWIHALFQGSLSNKRSPESKSKDCVKDNKELRPVWPYDEKISSEESWILKPMQLKKSTRTKGAGCVFASHKQSVVQL